MFNALTSILLVVTLSSGPTPQGAHTKVGTVVARHSPLAGIWIYYLQNEQESFSVQVSGSVGTLPRVKDLVEFPGVIGTDKAAQWAFNGSSGSHIKIKSTNQPLSVELIVSEDGKLLEDKLPALLFRYVAVTGFQFAEAGTFKAGRTILVTNAAGAKTQMQVGGALDGKAIPSYTLNLYGALTREKESFVIVPTRWAPGFFRKARELAEKQTCMTCHRTDAKVIGPSFVAIAAKYKDDSEAAAKIAHQIREGGSGKWGPVAMLPFKSKVSPPELDLLVQWIQEMKWEDMLK